MSEKVDFLGYEMTDLQKKVLLSELECNILTRYFSEEYWDFNIVNEFVHNNKLRRTDD